MIKLVGITGRARAGVSTTARILVDRYGYVEESFAAPIRSFVASLVGETIEEMDEHKETPHPGLRYQSPLWAMQSLETGWGYNMMNPGLWREACRSRAVQHLDAGSRVVISDVKFDDQAEMIRSMGGFVIKVVNPSTEDAAAKDHPLERGVKKSLIDAHICNDGSLDNLDDAIVWVLRSLAEKPEQFTCAP